MRPLYTSSIVFVGIKSSKEEANSGVSVTELSMPSDSEATVASCACILGLLFWTDADDCCCLFFVTSWRFSETRITWSLLLTWLRVRRMPVRWKMNSARTPFRPVQRVQKLATASDTPHHGERGRGEHFPVKLMTPLGVSRRNRFLPRGGYSLTASSKAATHVGGQRSSALQGSSACIRTASP